MMNPNVPSPWEWNINAPLFIQPLMSMELISPPMTNFYPILPVPPPDFNEMPMFQAPVLEPILTPTVTVLEPGLAPPALEPGLASSYAAFNSPFFTQQVPPSCLPNLRIPPPNPPPRGQQFWDPYITPPFSPTFGLIFKALLNEDGVRYDEKDREISTAVDNFRSLPLAEQLNHFMYARTLSAEQVRIRWQLVADILFILRQEFPMCEVYAFGSVISGLGDESSDIDIYVDLVGPLATSSLPSRDALEKTKRIVKKVKCPHSGRPFHSGPVIPITHARVPVLKMTHFASKISFDLTFENRISAQNSRLVVLYTNLDPRVFRFMILLRYWLKFHKLSGPNDIKNYAFTLLALTYLMLKGIIPSVYVLQKIKEMERNEQALLNNPDEIDGWDASFCGEPELIRCHFQGTPVPSDYEENPAKYLIEMMFDFFKIFAHTDLGSVVVCPLIGEIVLKGGFIPGNETFLTGMLDRYKMFVEGKAGGERLKIRSPLCIQDPFVLNFNVTSGTPLSSIVKFQIACAKSLEVITSKLQEDDGKAVSLLDLFTPLPDRLQSKDLFKSFKTYNLSKSYKREILGAFGMVSSAVREEEEDVDQHNKFVRLPRHLASMDMLMENSTYQTWLREIATSNIVQSPVSKQFSDIFWEHVGRCRLVKLDKFGNCDSADMLKLVLKLASLWKKFTLDFLDEFFEIALKLKVDVEGTREISIATEDGDIDDIRGIDDHQKWRILVPKLNESPMERKKKLRKRVEEIEDIREGEEYCYRMMSVQVTYPFWSNRPFALEEWKEGEKKKMAKSGKIEYKENPMQVERLISESVLKAHERPVVVGTSKGEQDSQGKENVERNDNVQSGGENHEKKKRLRLEKDNFTPWTINVFVKIKTNVRNTRGSNPKEFLDVVERPMAALVFENEIAVRNFKSGIAKLHALAQNMLPEYQIYRLREWLEIDAKSLK